MDNENIYEVIVRKKVRTVDYKGCPERVFKTVYRQRIKDLALERLIIAINKGQPDE